MVEMKAVRLANKMHDALGKERKDKKIKTGQGKEGELYERSHKVAAATQLFEDHLTRSSSQGRHSTSFSRCALGPGSSVSVFFPLTFQRVLTSPVLACPARAPLSPYPSLPRETCRRTNLTVRLPLSYDDCRSPTLLCGAEWRGRQ
jgi:hypothetical protein